MGFLDAVADVEVSNRFPQLKLNKEDPLGTSARFKVRVNNTILKKARGGPELFILEAEVLESTDARHPAGSARSWMQGEKDVQVKNVVLFAQAATGMSGGPGVDWKAVIKDITTNNTLAGKTVNVEVEKRKAKNGNIYDHFTWSKG